MSLLNIFPALILDTVLGHLARLFLTGAGDDPIAARHAAYEMLAAYHPRTPDELNLAAEVVSFSFHALDALSQAAGPAISLNQKLRLRGSAVSLSREAHKSQRKLDQLQKARHAGIPVQPAESLQPEPVQPIDSAPTLIINPSEAMATAGKTGDQTWTQGYQQRQAARRITENLKKNQANGVPYIARAAGTQNAALPGSPVSA